MRHRLRMPRLLPLAIAAMLALAALKGVGLVREALAEASRSATPAAAPAAGDTAQGAARAAGAAATAAPGARTGEAPPQVFSPPAPSAAEPPVSQAERALLLDLRKRRGELDGREQALAAREGVLAAAEKRIADRVEELAALQARLEALEKARTARDEENWRGLVKLYEAMKPRDAAAIFNDLDRPVLLAVLDRMKETKAAPILAAMQPERARQITADLAQRRVQANRPGEAPPVPPARGG